MSALLAVALAAVAAWCVLRVLLPSLRRLLLDQPNVRSSHSLPIPRGGGIAFVFVASTTSAISFVFYSLFGQPGLAGSQLAMVILPLLLLPLAVVGFLDDRHNLPVSLRYAVQLGSALLLILASPLSLPWLGLSLLLIAVTGVINFTNFMDGLDGLVAGCMAVAIGALSLDLNAPWSLWALVGSLLGFLFWNWSPAKVFMGDVGSTFLGGGVCGFGLTGFQLERCVLLPPHSHSSACRCLPLCTSPSSGRSARLPSPPPSSVSAAATGRLASLPCLSLLHLGDSVAGRGHAHRRPAVGFVSVRC